MRIEKRLNKIAEEEDELKIIENELKNKIEKYEDKIQKY